MESNPYKPTLGVEKNETEIRNRRGSRKGDRGA